VNAIFCVDREVALNHVGRAHLGVVVVGPACAVASSSSSAIGPSFLVSFWSSTWRHEKKLAVVASFNAVDILPVAFRGRAEVDLRGDLKRPTL